MTSEEVLDLIYSIKNRCIAIELLNTLRPTFDNQLSPSNHQLDCLMHTLSEDIFVDAQGILDGFCVVRDDILP